MGARAGSGRARSSPRRCPPSTRLQFSASRSTGERTLRARVAESRFSIDSPRRATIRSAYASRSSSAQVPPPTSSWPAASPLTGPAGSSWSWIQTIHLPSGARDGSTAHGWPVTIVASEGNSPRSASFTARETPSSPGVTWTIAVRPSRSASGPFPAWPLVEREVDLHPRAAVAVACRRGCVDVGRHVALAEQGAVELGRGHACDHGARRPDCLSVRQHDADGPAAGDHDPGDLGLGSEFAAGVTHDARERVDEPHSAADGNGHSRRAEPRRRSPGS